MSKHYRTGGRSYRQENSLRRRLKRQLLRESYNFCGYCGGKFNHKVLTIDHIVPVSKGGLTELHNLVLCCARCNGTKRDMTPGEWLDYLDEIKNQTKQHLAPSNTIMEEIFLI